MTTNFDDSGLPLDAFTLARKILDRLDAIIDGDLSRAARHRAYDALLIDAHNKIANLEGCDPEHRSDFFAPIINDITEYRAAAAR